MAEARSNLEQKEVKNDGGTNPNSLPSSVGIFSLKEICMDKFLSQEHQLDKEHIRQLCEAKMLNEEYVQFKQEKLKCVQEAIVQGDPDTALKMTETYPILLLEKLEEKDFVITRSGQKSAQKTPYQMALAEEDTQIAAKLRAQLIIVADEKEADAQFDEQRPKDWEVDEQKRWQPIFDQLESLTQAISTASGDITSSDHPEYKLTIREGSKVAIELVKFWSLLDAMLNEIVTTGRHFNPNLLLKAWQTYDDDKLYQKYFGGRWDDPRALLFWQKVIGYDGIQRIMPGNYVQGFHDWLDNTVKKLQNGEPQDRSTRFEVYRSGIG
jgi:hypothetical protein